MSKQYNIRWTDSDRKALSQAVRIFNSKITRLEKKVSYAEKGALPERMSVKELQSLISTRQDLKRELNSLHRFMEKGAEEFVNVPDNDNNLKITKWQKKEMGIRLSKINRVRAQRRKEVEELEMTEGGKPLGYTVGQFGMGKAEHVSLLPLKSFTPGMNYANLKMRFKHMVKESQDKYYTAKEEMMMNNYIKGILENYDPDDVEEIVENIRNMDFNDFYKTYQKEPGGFEPIYPKKKNKSGNSDNAEYYGYLEKLRSTWMPTK